jgi:hypothetical protein
MDAATGMAANSVTCGRSGAESPDTGLPAEDVNQRELVVFQAAIGARSEQRSCTAHYGRSFGYGAFTLIYLRRYLRALRCLR